MQKNIPSFAERNDCDKVNKNQDVPNGESVMDTLIDQKPHKTDQDREIPQEVSFYQRLCALKKSHVSAKKNIEDVKPDRRKYPGQSGGGSDFR